MREVHAQVHAGEARDANSSQIQGMKMSKWLTVGLLLAVAVAIVVALMREATSGPVFRAEDHASYEACVAAIPAEWEPGSLAHSGAQDACGYAHARPAAQ